MEKGIELFFIIPIFLINLAFVVALCEEGQIDINSASASELDEIIHVGPKVAEYIIEARPFDSVDDLVNVKYISSNYLADIKEEGLACVNENTEEEDEEQDVEEQEEDNEEETENGISEKEVDKDKDNDKNEDDEDEEPEKIINTSTNSGTKTSTAAKNAPVTLESIKLNAVNVDDAKNIKSSNEKENQGKSNYAMYGFIAFCILLASLFILKIRKNKYKNEFD